MLAKDLIAILSKNPEAVVYIGDGWTTAYDFADVANIGKDTIVLHEAKTFQYLGNAEKDTTAWRFDEDANGWTDKPEDEEPEDEE